MKIISRSLFALLLLAPAAMQAGTFTFSWTAGQLKNAINALPSASTCLTSVCGYYDIAADVNDAVLGTTYTLSGVAGPGGWTGTTDPTPPPAAVWSTTAPVSPLSSSTGVYLTDHAGVAKLADNAVFSLTLTSPALTSARSVNFNFYFTGDNLDSNPILKGLRPDTIVLSAAPVPEPGAYAALLGSGLSALLVVRARRRKIQN